MSGRDKRLAMGMALGLHALHDGYSDLVYLLLPVWQAEFALTYAAVGVLRSVLSGTMALFQIPAGLLAERAGGPVVLAAGTALAGLCFCLVGLSSGYFFIAAALAIGGLGASAQHPIGSALVARAFAGPQSLAAIGTYNFSGDVGKVLLPATATLLMLFVPWRATAALLGTIGIALRSRFSWSCHERRPQPSSWNALAPAPASSAEPEWDFRTEREALGMMVFLGPDGVLGSRVPLLRSGPRDDACCFVISTAPAPARLARPHPFRQCRAIKPARARHARLGGSDS